MTGRQVPEWIGATPDTPVPPRVKLRIWERCGGRCALTGKKLMPGDAYDFDHIRPLILGGENRESNLQLVSRDAHKAKTKADVSAKAKADRTRAKHLGVWPKSKAKIRSRGFAKSRPAGPCAGGDQAHEGEAELRPNEHKPKFPRKFNGSVVKREERA
jgi:hypothetical protein